MLYGYGYAREWGPILGTTYLENGPTNYSQLGVVEMKPTRANQYRPQLDASPRHDHRAHTKCTAIVVPSTTDLWPLQ